MEAFGSDDNNSWVTKSSVYWTAARPRSMELLLTDYSKDSWGGREGEKYAQSSCIGWEGTGITVAGVVIILGHVVAREELGESGLTI